MSAASIFFLFALVTGQGDSASFMTLGEFQDQASCAAASTAIETTLKGSTSPAHVFCVSGTDVTPLAKAAHPADQ